MADMQINDVAKELNTFLANNPTLISTELNRAVSALDQNTRPITRVKGQYPQGHTLLEDVVQGFAPEWNDLGGPQIEHKILKNYHQKVNFGLIPSQILNSYWADLYAENLTKEQMPISRYIIENELLPKVIDNMVHLAVHGEYDPNNLGVFGKSMDGIKKKLTDMLAADPATDHTPFKIPLSAITDTNIVDQMTLFERSLPSKLKRQINKVFVGENFAERHLIQYQNQFGQNQFQQDDQRTRLGKREIVVLDGYEGDLIFATTDNNFRRLIDVFDGAPAITDIQKQDYQIKIFMEFWKGYDFLIDQLVCVSNYTDNIRGLGTQALNQKYYGIDGVNTP